MSIEIWYHTWTVDSQSSEGHFELNLSREELFDRIIVPYDESRKFVCDGSIIEPIEVKKIQVYASTERYPIDTYKIKFNRYGVKAPTYAEEDTPKWFVQNTCSNHTRYFINVPTWSLHNSNYNDLLKSMMSRIDPNLVVLEKWIRREGKHPETNF